MTSPSTDPPMLTITHWGPPVIEDPRTLSGAEKSAATRRRREDEERGDKLTQIRAQVADGTLAIRQMTTAEHEVALQAASHSLERNSTRAKRHRALGKS